MASNLEKNPKIIYQINTAPSKRPTEIGTCLDAPGGFFLAKLDLQRHYEPG